MSEGRHVAIIERYETTERRAVMVPAGQSLDFDFGSATRKWLNPYLGTEWYLVEFVPMMEPPQ